MKKAYKFICFVVAIALLLPTFPAAAEANGGFDNFKENADANTAFADVEAEKWYASDIAEVCSHGIMKGVSATEFAPEESVNIASCIAIASRLSSIYYTGGDISYAGDNWYEEYLSYAVDKGIIAEPPEDSGAFATRALFMELLSNSLPEECFKIINNIEEDAIPDVRENSGSGKSIYKLYRAGIVIGRDDVHRAFPDEYIKRAEVAPVLLRMIKPQKRQSVNMNNHITVYHPEGREMSITADKFAEYESLDWSIYKETEVFAPDGNSITVPTVDKNKWLAVGWYEYPVATVYAPDGRAQVILQSEKDAYLAAGWYDYPVVTVYAPDGRAQVILQSEKDAYLEVGWYEYPVATVYAPDGRAEVILQSEKDAYLAVGWYGSPFIPLPNVLAEKGYTTNLPVISIGTGGKSISSRTDYVPCIVNTFNVESDLALNDAAGGIRIRGNASRAANPPPYRIKLDTKANLLGLNDGAKAKSWVLLNYPDGAVESIKNDIAFRMGRYLMDPDGGYCTDARFVHLYINTGFCGTYLLCEQTQVNKHRVDVNEPENGYTGTDVGYLVEIDNYSEPPYFRVDYEKAYVSDISQKSRTFRSAAYSIKSDVYSQEQKDFIANYVRGVFKIIYYACEKNTYLKFDENYNVVYADFGDAFETVANVIDIDSFVDMYILYEIMHDNDVGEGSFFMCVDFSKDSKHPKLTLTAPWDFNWTCFGSATGQLYASTFCTDSFMRTYGDRSNPWFIVLYKQWWFRELVSKKWTEIGGSAGIESCLSEETQMLDKYRADINRRMNSATERGKVYLNWIHNRAAWLDSLWMK